MCISVVGVKIWNSLTAEEKVCRNILQFEKRWKWRIWRLLKLVVVTVSFSYFIFYLYIFHCICIYNFLFEFIHFLDEFIIWCKWIFVLFILKGARIISSLYPATSHSMCWKKMKNFFLPFSLPINSNPVWDVMALWCGERGSNQFTNDKSWKL